MKRATLVSLLMVLILFGAFGQPHAFEVVSIKVAKDGESHPSGISGNRYSSGSMPLVGLIMYAYNLRPYQIFGAPSLLGSQYYVLEATAPGEGRLSIDQVRPMLQTAFNPPLPAGEAASIQPPYNVTGYPVTVCIDGQRADVQFSGAAPGFAGLFQINAIVPGSGLQGSSVPLQIQVNGKQSNTVTLATKP